MSSRETTGLSPDLTTYLHQRRQAVDAALEAFLPPAAPTATTSPTGLAAIHEAMRYAVLLGGKRMRPIITLAACEAAGGRTEQAMPAACALELVHAYSLVHDDLPAMDDDAERRGRPTVHVAFGEATAVLVGDALLTQAFEVLTAPRDVTADALVGCVRRLAHHAGTDGMVGGQGLDLAWGQGIDQLERLERVHALKTGGLYAAAGAMGALCSGASTAVVNQLERYGLAFGIAFQHADDVLDGDQIALREQALVRVDQLVDECMTIAGSLAGGEPLVAIAKWVQTRAHNAIDD
ncbi:MAG: polyprenyl synthetase family protein [Myxococcales bacterium FL481]|nr:MAG: polyprenyl synthetase family protein [Myxococcales bacterium FL481]